MLLDLDVQEKYRHVDRNIYFAIRVVAHIVCQKLSSEVFVPVSKVSMRVIMGTV